MASIPEGLDGWTYREDRVLDGEVMIQKKYVTVWVLPGEEIQFQVARGFRGSPPYSSDEGLVVGTYPTVEEAVAMADGVLAADAAITGGGE